MNNIFKMQNFAAVKDDGDGVLGKMLYYTLSSIMVDKQRLEEICAEINFPYNGEKRTSYSDAFRSATGDIHDSKVVTDFGEAHTIKIYCRDNKSYRRGEVSRELIKETLDTRTNQYKKLANITFSQDYGISYDDLVYDEHVDPMDYCTQAVELFELYQRCAGRKQVETLLASFVDSLHAIKIVSHGKLFFIPREYVSGLEIFEDFIEALEENNQHINKSRSPLDANSMFVVNDDKQREKMTSAFYRSVKRDIEEYAERANYFIQTGSQSPAVLDRWIQKIDALNKKKHEYEDILQRELSELDDEFLNLFVLSQELQIRSIGIRRSKAA